MFMISLIIYETNFVTFVWICEYLMHEFIAMKKYLGTLTQTIFDFFMEISLTLYGVNLK